jgi:dCTP diphosphatase
VTTPNENSLDLNAIASALRDFAAERDWDQFHSPKNLASALVVEAGELLEHFQWLTEKQSFEAARDPQLLARITEEVADVLIYAIRLSDIVGLSLSNAIDDKIAANSLKYPVAKSRGRATKYTDL